MPAKALTVLTHDQPFLFSIAPSYTTQKLGRGPRFLAEALRDWNIGAFLQYASGLPIQSPAAQNALASQLFRSTFADRVAGQPLFLQDLNCHCYDPNKSFVLNKDAWAQPAAGQWGTSAAYYTDYRFQRRPVENLAVGRTFRMSERVNLNVRAEFNNIYNRTYLVNPVVNNALATQTAPTGRPTAGFGWVNTASVFNPPRNGTIVARFQF